MGKEFSKKVYKTVTDLMNDFIRLRRDGGYVFRGISRETDIFPNITRIYDCKDEKCKDLAKHEFDFLYRFYKEGRHYFNGSFEMLDYIAYAQHYGVPTRFIDWTKDPFVALYFAIVKNDKPSDGRYRIYYTNLNKHLVIENAPISKPIVMGNQVNNFVLDYIEFTNLLYKKKEFLSEMKRYYEELEEYEVSANDKVGSELNESDFMVFYNCPYLNDRIKAQEGLFSLPSTTKTEMIKKELISNTSFIEIEINETERDKAINYLENLGYTEPRLFPEPASLGNHLTNEALKRYNMVEQKEGFIDEETSISNSR